MNESNPTEITKPSQALMLIFNLLRNCGAGMAEWNPNMVVFKPSALSETFVIRAEVAKGRFRHDGEDCE